MTINPANISPIISSFASQGVPTETTILLLMLPIIATFIATLRQIVGVKAFGIYTPTIVTFAFLYMGIKYAAAIFIAILIIGMLSRFFLKYFRLLYLPRVAITISIIAVAILAMLVTGGTFQRTGLAAVSIFPLLIMITITEKFVAAQIEKGNKTALLLAIETLVIAAVGYYLLSWNWLIGIIASYPWLVILTVPINIILGKWTGLRLIEYFRFREVLKKM